MPDRRGGLRRRDGRTKNAARPPGGGRGDAARTRRGRSGDAGAAQAQASRLRNGHMLQASASAPASIGNVGVGFDILGQAFDAARDRVTAFREADPAIRLGAVAGLVKILRARPDANTALAAGRAVLRACGEPFGIRLDIEKGVPLSAGMGGSAASAVAGAAAVNALLGEPFAIEELLPFALEGERAASDPPPWDNVVASLLGGLVL